MKQRTRIYYTVEQKAVMWNRWQKGESLHEIGRLFDRCHTSFQRIVSETGGVRPAKRTRSDIALSLSEREGALNWSTQHFNFTIKRRSVENVLSDTNKIYS